MVLSAPHRFFDSNSYSLPNVIEPSGWLEHGPFAMWFIARLKPNLFVELGTHNGYSYFSFAQSVVSNNLNTKMYAIDTWKGDEHAGFYGDDVFNSVSDINSSRYSSFSYLLRNTFEQGLDHFQNESIDVLHIDGLHTYDAVKHDFETWLPKMSENGVVLFHDISVRERGFGVFQLWEEISSKYPSFSFIHGNGLGVAKVGKLATEIDFLFTCDEEQALEIQNFYACLGRRISLEFEKKFHHSQILNREYISKSELEVTKSELEVTKSELEVTKSELEVTKSELEVTKSELEVTKSELEVTKSELEVTKSELIGSRNDFKTLHAQNVELRNSISWKVTGPFRRVHSWLPSK